MNYSKSNRIARRLTGAPAILAALIAAVILSPAAAVQGQTKAAYDYLAEAIANEETSTLVISSFHAAGDKELTPLFVALSRSANKRKRLLATTALGQLGGDEAIAALKRQLANDSEMAVRAAALVHLLNIEAADAAVLSAATKLKDENIQCIAARSLANISKDSAHQALARQTLQGLTGSSEAMTSSMASLGLLAMGDSSRLAGLKKQFADPKTETTVLRLAMLQIVDEKIAAGQPLAQIIIDSPKRPIQTRILACRALAASSPKPVPALFAALRNSPTMLFRIPAMSVLSKQDDSKRYLVAIAKSTLPVGKLAAFELARATPGPAATKAVQAAMSIKHPIAINHVFQRASKDIETHGAKADFYTAPLLKFIESVEPDTDRMTHQHLLAAQATTLLADIGTPRALAGLAKIMSGRYSAITRAAAAGLMRSKNKAVAPIARKLLSNPYPELATYGALTLGHFADPAAKDHFNNIIKRQSGHTAAEITLSCWYLLKINKQSAQSAKQLAQLIK